MVFSLIANLISGRQQRKAQRRAEYNASPAGIRKNAEAAGFNPLVFAGPGVGLGYQGTMGYAYSDALSQLGDYLDGRVTQRLQRQRLEAQNAKLKRRLTAQTVRNPSRRVLPYQPQQRRQTPYTPGRRQYQPEGSNPHIGPRPIERVESANSSGLMEIDNRFTHGPITVPGDTEPWDLWQIMAAGAIGLPQIINNRRFGVQAPYQPGRGGEFRVGGQRYRQGTREQSTVYRPRGPRSEYGRYPRIPRPQMRRIIRPPQRGPGAPGAMR